MGLELCPWGCSFCSPSHSHLSQPSYTALSLPTTEPPPILYPILLLSSASWPTPPTGSLPGSAPLPPQPPPSPQAGCVAPTLDGGLGCTCLSHFPGSTLKTRVGPLSQILGLPLHHHTHTHSVLPSQLLALQFLSAKEEGRLRAHPAQQLCESCHCPRPSLSPKATKHRTVGLPPSLLAS